MCSDGKLKFDRPFAEDRLAVRAAKGRGFSRVLQVGDKKSAAQSIAYSPKLFSWFVLAFLRATLRQACDPPARRLAGRFNFQEKNAPSMTTAERNRRNGMDEPALLIGAKTQVRSGLTGRAVLLPSDDAAAFEQHAADAEEGTPAPSNVENLIKYEKT